MRRAFILLALAQPIAVFADGPASQPSEVMTDAHAAPFWLRRGIAECELLLAPTTRHNPGFVSPLNLIAIGQAQAGDAEGLRRTLQIIRSDADAQDDAAQRSLGYATLAGHALALGDQVGYRGNLARAKQAAIGVDGEYMRPIVDQQIAQLQARGGDFTSARLVAGETFEPLSKALQYCALAWLAHQQNNADLADEFTRMARRCTADQDEITTSTVLLHVGQLQAARHDFAGARYSGTAIPLSASRAELYRTMAAVEAKAGDLAAYRDTLTLARESAARTGGGEEVWQLALLCRTQMEAKDRNGAEETLHSAIVAAESQAASAEKASAWFDVADAQASMGDLRACRKSITQAQEHLLDLPPHPAAAIERARRQYVAVILSLARAGEMTAAADLAKTVTDPQDISAIYWAMTDAQSRSGNVEGAQLSLAKVREPMYRAFACRRLARAFVQRRDIAGLSQWIDNLAGPEERSWAALGAAEGLIGCRIVNPDAGAMAQLEMD